METNIKGKRKKTKMILEVSNLGKRYDKSWVVSEVNVQVDKGEFVALLGPNGAGKSTFFSMITGEKTPSSGKVKYFGKDITNIAPYKRTKLGMARTFQITSIFPGRTVRENIQTSLLVNRGKAYSFFGIAKGMFREEARDIVNLVGLYKEREKLAGSLSHGDKKLLDLGIALASQPKLLLMDEPTQGMASFERYNLIDLVKQIARDQGITVVFTEHDMDVVFKSASRIIVMHQGKVLFNGKPDDARGNPEIKSIYLKEF